MVEVSTESRILEGRLNSWVSELASSEAKQEEITRQKKATIKKIGKSKVLLRFIRNNCIHGDFFKKDNFFFFALYLYFNFEDNLCKSCLFI